MTRSIAVALTRGRAVLGRLSMYRLVLFALIALAVIAFAISFTGQLVSGPVELLTTLAVLVAVCLGTDAVAQRVLRLPVRLESSVITALILLFVVRPSVVPLALAGVGLAGVAASASKYLLAWRGRHIFNPAAVGAAVLTLVGLVVSDLGSSAWWVGTPLLVLPVLLLGLAVLWRTEKLTVAAVFWTVATVVSFARIVVQYQQAGMELDLSTIITQLLTASPFLFLAAFMLSEPLTLPPRRWQQLAVATVVGLLAGWPISVGLITLGQERALLIGNLLAFMLAFPLRRDGSARLELLQRSMLTPTTTELTFRARNRLPFRAGQYLELSVPHHQPDSRGTRREFSIVSAPEDLPMLRIAYRESGQKHSSYKHALATVEPGQSVRATGVWGDFILPGDPRDPILMVAAGIGVTPFVSQLRHLRAQGQQRDIVLVYVASDASELALRKDLAASGIAVVVFTPTEPANLPAGWTWAGDMRVDAAQLERTVPDLAARHAFVSGPPRLISDLAKPLGRARSLRTDAFSGY